MLHDVHLEPSRSFVRPPLRGRFHSATASSIEPLRESWSCSFGISKSFVLINLAGQRAGPSSGSADDLHFAASVFLTPPLSTIAVALPGEPELVEWSNNKLALSWFSRLEAFEAER